MPATLSHEVRYRLLRYLADHPDASQRELARELSVSVGKVNYCLRALMEKGWVKARNFRNSNHKAGYLYVLTPKGIEEKVNVTSAFLRRKLDEYDLLQKEIERLTREVSELGSAPADESA
jgi:EPS-associated MarR family transcriptional regulator